MTTTTPPPLIAELITTCDEYSTLMRAALAALDDAPELRRLAERARALDRQYDALLHELAAAGYTQSAVAHALVAAGRPDLVESIGDALDALADESQQDTHS